jgi:hypothetical protein
MLDTMGMFFLLKRLKTKVTKIGKKYIVEFLLLHDDFSFIFK